MAATKGRTATVGYGDTSNGTFTALTTVIDINPPGVTVGAIDTTHHTSTSEYKERIAGWKDMGPFALKLQYDKTQHGTLSGLLGTMKYWKVTFPDASTLVFQGFITKIDLSSPLEGIIESDIEITTTGVPTFTAGA
jgi:predicted secreted protein